MPHPHPDKPTKGTLAHRQWVVGLLEAYVHTLGGRKPTYKGFIAHEKQAHDRTGRVNVSTRDVSEAGGFAALLALVLGKVKEREPLRRDVSIEDLDWDELPDTQPNGTPIIVTSSRAQPLLRDAEPRDAEPREVLAARRATEAQRAAERKVKRLAEELEQAEARNEILDALGSSGPLIPVVPREPTSGLREAAAFVACSDWHIEEVVDPATVEHRNAYTPEIARRRIERMLMGVLWLVNMHRERFLIRDLVMWLGGDLLSGYIHEELEETNAMSPPEATVWLQDVLGGAIQTLLDRGGFERIIVPCNTGNHGRTVRRKRYKTSVKNSYEYIVYCHLAQRFKDEPRVQFEIAKGGHVYLPIYDTRVRMHHGDDVRYWGGVGGLSIPLNKAVSAWEKFKPADLTVIGHFHQLLHGRDWVVNGSLIGYNEFALGIKAEFEPPQQAFFLIDKHRGRTCASPIWVEERDVDWSREWKRR